MEESILVSIKKMLGLMSDDNSFDLDIIVNINSVIAILSQIGVEPIDKNFSITGDTETWSDYLEQDSLLNVVKSYMYLKVKKMFDPPTGSVATSLDSLLSELEWRINTMSDPSRQIN